MKKVEVLFRGWGQSWVLGTLADNTRDVIFEYSAEALQRNVELSRLNLALRPQAYGRFPAHLMRLPGLVSDALPDGWGLLLMDRLFLKSGRNPASVSPLDRLSFIGDRAMGALSFRPAAELQLTEDDLNLLQLATAVTDVIADRDTAALTQLALVGGSPHGARPKALVQFDDSARTISARDDAAGTNWLIKFPARHEHKEVCAVEAAYGVVAGACGLEVPRTRFFDIGAKFAAFGIERFDRAEGRRVPVHSFAGALHADFRLPSLDYQAVLRATRFFTQDATQVEAAYKRCVFNVLFNNRDDHAKNFSLRMNETMAWKLAPAYDLTFNEGPGGCHQTSIMGEAAEPARSHLLALASDAEIRKSSAEAVIDHMLETASLLRDQLRHGAIRRATARSIVAAVERNLRRCSRRP